MSFALDDQPDSEVDETGQASGTGRNLSQAADSGISLGGGGSGTVGPTGGNVGGSNQTAQAQNAKPSSSGSWTNLQSYLDANADQGATVGNQIAGTVSGQAQKAQDDVSSASSDFMNNVNANTVNADSGAVNKAISDATSAKAGADFDPNDVTSFQKQANANYAGPTDFTKEQGYGQAQQDLNTAQQSLAETGSEAGREVLLGDQFKNASASGYNQGEKNLDNLLLQGSAGGQAALQPLPGQWSELSSALGNASTSANAAAQAGIATDAATAKAAQDALSGANTKFQSDLTTQTAAAKASNSAAYDQAMKDLAAGQITPEEAQVLGMSASGNENVYNIDATKYLSKTADPTMFNSATADQYAQAAALAKLAGQDSSAFLPGTYASQAGTAGHGYAFDTGGFGGAVSGAQNDYNTQNTALSTQLSTLQSQLALAAQQDAWDAAHDPNQGGKAVNMDGGGSVAAAGGGHVAAVNAQIAQVQAAQSALTQKYNPTRTIDWRGIQSAVGAK